MSQANLCPSLCRLSSLGPTAPCLEGMATAQTFHHATPKPTEIALSRGPVPHHRPQMLQRLLRRHCTFVTPPLSQPIPAPQRLPAGAPPATEGAQQTVSAPATCKAVNLSCFQDRSRSPGSPGRLPHPPAAHEEPAPARSCCSEGTPPLKCPCEHTQNSAPSVS